MLKTRNAHVLKWRKSTSFNFRLSSNFWYFDFWRCIFDLPHFKICTWIFSQNFALFQINSEITSQLFLKAFCISTETWKFSESVLIQYSLSLSLKYRSIAYPGDKVCLVWWVLDLISPDVSQISQDYIADTRQFWVVTTYRVKTMEVLLPLPSSVGMNRIHNTTTTDRIRRIRIRAKTKAMHFFLSCNKTVSKQFNLYFLFVFF